VEHPFHFTIAAPHYTPSSNGVVLLYRLGELLERSGHKVSFVPNDRHAFETHRSIYSDELLRKFIPNPADADPRSIAIFPETTPAEIIAALPAKRRIFYLLNRPYTLTGRPLLYRPDDLVVAYSGLISKVHFNLFITNPILEFEQFEETGASPPPKEDLILFYFGKTRHDKIPPAVSRVINKYNAEVVVMNRVFPKSRETLFDLLRRARLLVSFDPLTNLSYEATLCGTPSFIADNYMNLSYGDFNLPLAGFFEDEQQVEHRYKYGINKDEQASIIDGYRRALAENGNRVTQFTNLCRDWFSLNERALHDPVLMDFLMSHNQFRLELDKARFQASGGQRIDHAFHCYTPVAFGSTYLQRLINRIIHRKDRLIWNMKRNWHKHISGLRGEALTAKLEKMREEYELQKMAPRHLKSPLR
jgi:hypothetical protein